MLLLVVLFFFQFLLIFVDFKETMKMKITASDECARDCSVAGVMNAERFDTAHERSFVLRSAQAVPIESCALIKSGYPPPEITSRP